MSGIIKRLRDINLPSVSTSLIALIIIALSIFILGGGVYDIMEQPMAILPTPSNPGYYPDIASQFLTESITIVFFLIMGILGGYISFRSTRYAYRPREAKIFLAIGASMLVVALIGAEVSLLSKI